MISVRNRRRLLSGNKGLILVAFLSFLASCSVLKPTVPKSSTPSPEKPIEPKPSKVEPEKKVEVSVNKVMLLLPFQLDKIRDGEPSRADVKRAEMPLDFYQGFKLALDNLAKEGKNFQLNVVDTRDNVVETGSIARSSDVQAADLVVGPIFPREISAFASAAKLGYSLQVSPLAASDPSSFNISNLVSLSTPISQHAEGLAVYLTKKIKNNDRIIVYHTKDAESQKFLAPLIKKLNELSEVDIEEVMDLEDLETKMTTAGKNYFIASALNKYIVDAMLVKLLEVRDEFGYAIQLVGHPNWAKSSFLSTNLKALNTLITTSYYVDESSSKVKSFRKKYQETYHVEPSEFAYKGFDTGYFFGSLLAKYGPDFSKSLLKESYKGLQANYTFDYNSSSGYVNTFIQILQFDGSQYQPIN